MGAYDNPKVPIVDYSGLTKNMMQQFAFWNNLWEKRRQSNIKNRKNADDLELKRLQGTFVEPTKELGVEYTSTMTNLFRDMVDKKVWENCPNAACREQIIQRVKEEAAGAKMIHQLIGMDLSQIDKGEDPNLYGLANAVKGFKMGNKSNFRMVAGRYYGGSENRSDQEKFMYVPGQIGLTYAYDNEDGETVFFNANELQSVIANIRNAKELYEEEYGAEITEMAKSVGHKGSNFNSRWHRYSPEQRTGFITKGEAKEGIGYDYEGAIDTRVDSWILDEDNYDLAAGIYRNYISDPPVESHIFKPSKSQLNEMIMAEGKYQLENFGEAAHRNYVEFVQNWVDLDADNEITDEEVTKLHEAQHAILKEHIKKDIMNSDDLKYQTIIEPVIDDTTDGDDDDDDEFKGITVAGTPIEGGTETQLGMARDAMSVLQAEMDKTSSRVPTKELLNNESIINELKAIKAMDKIYKLSNKWTNKGAIEWLQGSLDKKEENRTANEKEAIEIYSDAMATYDPKHLDIVKGSKDYLKYTLNHSLIQKQKS